MNILLLNAGSSSLKASLMDADSDETRFEALADWAGPTTRYRFGVLKDRQSWEAASWTGPAQAIERFTHDLTQAKLKYPAITAVGHRIVHGGPFTSSVRITPDTRERIAALADLAPLHNPASMEALGAAEKGWPDVPHVAVFDTAFHATLLPEAWTYPIPARWTRECGIRRFGFHGLSHAYCARRAAEMLERSIEALRLVICHLGHGCSPSAVRAGRCVDTIMGYTPLDGLMMGTRCGSLDPSIVLHVQQHHGLTAAQVENALDHESGLLGVSGVSSDMREVLDASKAGNQPAELALAIYTHRVRRIIGAFAVTMGGVDAVVFTAGVSEHAASVRESICRGLECLGLRLDARLNGACQPDTDVAAHDSAGRILVIATREDLTMLHEVVQVLNVIRSGL